MAKMPKEDNNQWRDPRPYDGPIERADGSRPYNGYLWPTESWWANRELDFRIHSRWNFGIIALADGRFSINGHVDRIELNNETYEWEKRAPKPCVFNTRAEAIRYAAARLIRNARQSRQWEGWMNGQLQGAELARVINWIRAIVARETGQPEPAPIAVKEPPKPRPKTGLPLFDL